MAAYAYYPIVTRLRIDDDDGTAAIEVTVPTDAGDDEQAGLEAVYTPAELATVAILAED